MMTATAPDLAGIADPADRGRLTIHERVVVRIAEEAAVEAGGWRERRGLAPGLGARSLPRASAQVVGRHVHLSLVVGSRLDTSLPDAADEIRTAVSRRVEQLTGLTVDDVDVRLARFSDATSAIGAQVLPAAARPAAPGSARKAGLLLAAVLLAMAGAAIHASLVEFDVLGGTSLVDRAVSWIDGLRAQDWMVPAGVGLALVGVWLVIAAVRPRPRRSLELTSLTGVHASRRAIENVVIDAAGRHPGVVRARALARRGYVVARIDTDGDAEVASEVADAIRARLSPLAGSPDIRVRASRVRGDR